MAFVDCEVFPVVGEAVVGEAVSGTEFAGKVGEEVGVDVGIGVVGIAVVGVDVGFAVVGVFVGLAVFPKERSFNTGLSPVDARTNDTRTCRYCPVPLRVRFDNSW